MIIAALAAMLLAIPAMVQSKKGEAAKAKTLEVSFDYQRQAGPGSNQYAVWIENEKGDVVKTLFVTSYTTKGRARGGERLRVGEQSSGIGTSGMKKRKAVEEIVK